MSMSTTMLKLSLAMDRLEADPPDYKQAEAYLKQADDLKDDGLDALWTEEREHYPVLVQGIKRWISRARRSA